MRSTVITVLVLVLALLGGLVYPTWKHNKTLQAEQEALVARFDEVTKALQVLGEEQQQKNSQGKNLIRKIPPTLNQAEVLRDIWKLTQQLSYSFPSLQFSKGVDPVSNATQLTAQFTIEGPTDNLTNFLETIEGNEPFLGLKTFNVSLIPETNGAQMRLAVSLYTLSLR